ncbi:hypothetical protein CP973_32250 [Streptomyces albofaciens JCM 4342]|uniref:hypothetical protein n=1 Tax=Streptomyces albofaciens TaxID=66866 RepID=UPI00123A3AA1|nr:hypothetical protein [Streptomyces albofaciens]KAA6213856.1 hypothetical protein CP973_32250 [Streptomyces albofaciens JCM 4342]
MATHRTVPALVSAAAAGALALGATAPASASDGPKSHERNQSIIVDDIGRLADASTELAEKSAEARGHSVQVRAARTRLDSVLADAQRLAEILNKDSDRATSADTVRLGLVSQDLRVKIDELTGRRAPSPEEPTDPATRTGQLTESVSRSVVDIFKILGVDKLVGDLRQQPADGPAAQPANRPIPQPAGQAADEYETDEQPAAQPKAPTSDPRPPAAEAPRQQPADGEQRPGDAPQQPAAEAPRQQPAAEAPQQQPAEAPQQQGTGSLLNSVLSLPTVLIKALGL